MSGEIPEAFLQRLEQLHRPEDRPAVLASFSAVRPTHARVNTLRTDREAVLARLHADEIAAEPVSWSPVGLSVPAEQRELLTHHPLVESGDLYVQGAASWLAAMVLDPQPGEEVLDLAAAPGGKSLHLAARMQNQGRLACVEAVKGRFFRLKANLERGGVTIAQLYLRDGRGVGTAVPERFDRILLDAPCSSEARFVAGEPSSWSHWSPRKVREQAHKQRGLLKSAWRALKPGGTLLYATCSLSVEENEKAVAWLLGRQGDAEVLSIDLPGAVPSCAGLTRWEGKDLDPRLARTQRVLPNAAYTGLYLALLRKP